MVAVFKSEATKDGLFFTGRCDRCKAYTHGENVGILCFEPITDQRNDWRSR
jgi:hypothetical protein